MSEDTKSEILKNCLEADVQPANFPDIGGGDGIPTFITGLKGKIDEQRSVEMMLLSDNSFSIKFFNGEEKTGIRLSDEAIKLTFALWMRLNGHERSSTDLQLNL